MPESVSFVNLIAGLPVLPSGSTSEPVMGAAPFVGTLAVISLAMSVTSVLKLVDEMVSPETAAVFAGCV
jgi:hypothetical protein